MILLTRSCQNYRSGKITSKLLNGCNWLHNLGKCNNNIHTMSWSLASHLSLALFYFYYFYFLYLFMYGIPNRCKSYTGLYHLPKEERCSGGATSRHPRSKQNRMSIFKSSHFATCWETTTQRYSFASYFMPHVLYKYSRTGERQKKEAWCLFD